MFRSLKAAFDSKNQNPFSVPLSADLWPAMKTLKVFINIYIYIYTIDRGKRVRTGFAV